MVIADFEPAAPASANVAARLSRTAVEMPAAAAVIEPLKRRFGRRRYREFTFEQLDRDSDRIAQSLVGLGVGRRSRLVLMVRPSFDFISLVFAIFKSGAIAVFIDPGMGARNMLCCLAEVRPHGFIAIRPAQLLRRLFAGRFPDARLNVTVGGRGLLPGLSLQRLRSMPANATLPGVEPYDPAAIIFTSGSTGPAKGVLYSHANFNAQVDAIRDRYAIEPGGIDLACFPLFGLFNCAMGVTTVIPDMNASRPATVDPRNLVEAVRDCRVTQAFASPAVWKRVTDHCHRRGIVLPTLQRVFSAGAPVSPGVLERLQACIHPQGEAHTPYGATEALPIATISASQVLGETRARSAQGAGTCVGSRFPHVAWKIIRIVDGPVHRLEDADLLPAGEVGELVVSAPQVTRSYVTCPQANDLAKIRDGDRVWHRLGDVGYLDQSDRFWYCGRLSQRVVTAKETLFTEPCECIINQHPGVARSGLVGIGARGCQVPAMVIEPRPGCWPRSKRAHAEFLRELRQLALAHATTASIECFLFKRWLPVDARHNSKIVRERLARWAVGRLHHDP